VAGDDGTFPFQYSIGAGYGTSGTFCGLMAGTYTINVKDAHNCTYPVPVNITQPLAALSGSISSQSNIDCKGNNNGSVTVTGNDGTSSYQYNIGNGFSSSGTFSGLYAGLHTVTVRDAHNCTYLIEVNITEPVNALSGSITSKANVGCHGASTGHVTVAGGFGSFPYQYSIGGAFATSGTFENLAAGDYTITVLDAHNCTYPVPVNITEPATSLTGNIVSQTNIDCQGNNDGSVTVSGHDGTAPYQYSIGAGFSTNGTFSSLLAGTLTINVKDDHGCIYPIVVDITEPQNGTLAGDAEVCTGSNSGTVFLSGQTEPVIKWQASVDGGNYWSDIANTQTTQNYIDLTATTMYRAVTGNGTCPALYSGSSTITMKGRHNISGWLKYNNTEKSVLSGVTVSLTDMNGIAVGTSSVTNSSGAYQFSDLCDGQYKIVITNNNKLAGSINSTDASQVNAWLTNPTIIDHVKFLAGDVYGYGIPEMPNFVITANDAFHIQEYFIYGGNQSTNYTYFDRNPWSYYKADSIVINNMDPNRYLDGIEAQIAGNDLTLNIDAQVTGDFNCSYLPEGSKSSNAKLTLSYQDKVIAGAEEEFELPVHVANSTRVTGISLILNFPDDLVEIKNVYLNDNKGQLDWAVTGNELRIGWNSILPMDLAASDQLIVMSLKSKAAFNDKTNILFTLANDERNELAGADHEVIPDCKLTMSQVSASAAGIQDPTTPYIMTIANYPNPFTNQTSITYTLPFDGKVTLEIHNILGQTIYTLLNEQQTKGDHRLTFDAKGMNPGICTATLKLENLNTKLFHTIKMIRNN
jgi:hypothetical protein